MGLKELFSTKKSGEKRKLGFYVLLFITINSILGSSLFYLPNLGVISSGAASIIAWIAIFIIAVVIMAYIGELVVLHPSSGGTYEFCKRAYGRFGSFIAGWLIWIAGNFGMALNIVAAAQYFIPEQLGLQLVFAAIWIIVLNYMAYRSIDAGATMLVVFGVIATFVVLLMTLPAFIDIRALFGGSLQSVFSFDLLQPFFRHEGLGILSYMGLSLLLISEAFLGFEVVTYMSNEVRNKRELPRVLVWGTVISGVIMSIYVFSSLGVVQYHDYVNNLRPFAVHAFNTMGAIGQSVVVFGMYLVIIGAAAAWPIAGSRLLRAMAGDKLFLKHFAESHPKHGSPYRAVIFQAVAVALFAWFIFRGSIVGWQDSYRSIYLIYVLISLVVLSLILLSVPILRKKESHLKREYKAPLGFVGPIALVVLFIVLIVNWFLIEGGVATALLLLAGSFIIFGLPVYFFVEMLYNSKAIVGVNNWLAYVSVFGETIFFPFTIRGRFVREMGNLTGHRILEYGCSVGSLTKKLAHKVGSHGRVYATDISEHRVKVAGQRTKKHRHVSVHHHPHLHDFRLSLPEKVDHVVSIGMLSYMQKPKRVLSKIAENMEKGGEVIFIDYDKFFWLIPNVKWVENDVQLHKIFHDAGFDVQVHRKNSLFWQYIIVKGKKR